MNRITIFDVLVVYTEAMAVSASEISEKIKEPFSKGYNKSYNVVYGYFLEVCAKNNLKVAFCTSADIVGAGCCDSYWIFENKKWQKRNGLCFSSMVFDKFSPTRKKIKAVRKIMFSSDEIKPFNDPLLFEMFFDKQNTFDELSEYAIPTISLVESTLSWVRVACNRLKKMMKNHPDSVDFGEDIILKDRFGAGGRHVYKFNINQTKEIEAVLRKTSRISFIIQPFVDFERGFHYKKNASSTDIRLIYLNSQLIQSYIRVARPGDFRCNEHQGGSLIYLSLSEVPKRLVVKSSLVVEKLGNDSLYALDFIVSNNGNVFLLEGNTGPGLDWNMSIKRNEIESKKLIDLIVDELAMRVASQENSFERSDLDDFVRIPRFLYSG